MSVVVSCVLVAPVHAQRRYELIVEGTDVVSQAERTPQRLVIIDSGGRATEYARDRRFDSEDRGFIAYSSAGARQILRWPVNDRGKMQIAELVGGRPTAFRPSRMTIRPLEAGGGAGGTGGWALRTSGFATPFAWSPPCVAIVPWAPPATDA